MLLVFLSVSLIDLSEISTRCQKILQMTWKMLSQRNLFLEHEHEVRQSYLLKYGLCCPTLKTHQLLLFGRGMYSACQVFSLQIR